MHLDDLILVSVDDHLVEPADLFETHLDAKWRDRAPKIVHTDDGSDVWKFGDVIVPNVGLNAVAGRPKEEYGVDPAPDPGRARVLDPGGARGLRHARRRQPQQGDRHRPRGESAHRRAAPARPHEEAGRQLAAGSGALGAGG